MKTILLLAAFLPFFVVRSQQAFHVVQEGASWRIETTDILVRSLFEITEVGDDEVGGELCQKLQVQSYARWSSNNIWGPLITHEPSYLCLRKNGVQVEIYRDSTWNLLCKTQTYIGEVWYQGRAWNGVQIYVKVVDVDENTGDIFTQACNENGDLFEPFTQEYNNAF